MKYSFTADQPWSKASVTERIRSASVTPLLITSLSRWVPASGARVSAVFLTFCVCLSVSVSTLSMRWEGSAMRTRRAANFSTIARASSGRQE